MSRYLIFVEGDTEEQFVKGVLAPHFANDGKYLIPKIATTKRLPGKPHFKGGIGNYGKVKNDILRLCRDTAVVCITTMIDYHGLPRDFPNMSNLPRGSSLKKVRFLEDAFAKDIGDRRFVPYLALHEFEAMLFASPEHIAQNYPGTNIDSDLTHIRGEFASPEDIDDEEHPSKRLIELIPGYQKPTDGLSIARAIGLARIRAECPIFDDWVSKLEALGSV